MDTVVNVLLVVCLSVILIWHSIKIRGLLETSVLATISSGIGVLVEYVGVTSGGYTYVGQNLLMITAFTGFGWIANTLLALHITAVLLNVYNYDKPQLKKIFQIGFLTGLVGVIYDLFTDPVATALKVWVWAHSGPWFGVPIGNFVGWFVILASSTTGYFLTIRYSKSKIQILILTGFFIVIGFLFVLATMYLCLYLGI